MLNLSTFRVSLVTVAILATSAASAQSIVGGSNILINGDAAQLGTWLGEGPLALTKIYSTKAFDPFGFHAAVDQKGRTFTVASATLTSTGEQFVVGGYADDSWYSQGAYHLDFDPADRNNFIFNLTTGKKLEQTNAYSVWDENACMPCFGGGYDLTFGTAGLGSSFATHNSYGSGNNANVFGETGTDSLFTWTNLEVFTISPDAVPEPATYAALAFGLAALAKRRK